MTSVANRRCAPRQVVFPDALDVRVLKAAHYLQQQGLAHPILVASPFALRQFALGERLPLTGVQVIDPHSNLAMREAFAAAWQARAGDKAPADAVDKLADPLMFAAAMVSAGQAEVCIAGNLSSTASVLRAGLRLIGLQPGCKNALFAVSDAAAVYRTAAGVCRLQRGAAADRGAAGGYRDCQRRDLASDRWRSAAGGNAVLLDTRQRPASLCG